MDVALYRIGPEEKPDATVASQIALLLLTGELRRFATSIDLESGALRSRSITRAEVAGALGKRPGFFKE